MDIDIFNSTNKLLLLYINMQYENVLMAILK